MVSKAVFYIAGGLIILSLVYWGRSVFGIRSTPEPAYSLIVKEGEFEIRRYEPVVVVSVVTGGDYRRSTNDGFMALAAYIGGDNRSNAEIPMTAPVLQQGEEISMTAPVQQQATTNGWETGFFLPAHYTMATAPLPTNPRLNLREQPAGLAAVLRYSGLTDAATIDRKGKELHTWLSAAGYRATGKPRSARYDHPATLPWFRRNEVLIDVEMRADLPADPEQRALSIGSR